MALTITDVALELGLSLAVRFCVSYGRAGDIGPEHPAKSVT
jgi:hypothetical protein